MLGDLVEAFGVGDGEFGVAAGREAQVGHHPPAEPPPVHAVAERVHDPGDLPGRARSAGAGRSGQRALMALPQGRVEQVHPGRGDRDPHLAGARDRVGDLLVGQVLGRAERVQADGVHGTPQGDGAVCPRLSDLKRA